MKDNTKEEKICTRCNTLKKKDEFPIIKDYKENSMKLYSMCKLCDKENRSQKKKELTRIKHAEHPELIRKMNPIMPETDDVNTKICCICEEEKEILNFDLKILKTGRVQVANKCKECRRKINLDLYYKKLKELGKDVNLISIEDIPKENKRVCQICLEEKDIYQFEKVFNKQVQQHYHKRTCKSCYNKVRVARRASKDKGIDRSEFRKINNKTVLSAKHRFNSIAQKSGIKIDYSFMTVDWYNLLLEKQNHSCAICNTHESELSKRLSIDHCHTTGKVRGLLCTHCNTGIGALKDNIESLKNAIKYLETDYQH